MASRPTKQDYITLLKAFVKELMPVTEFEPAFLALWISDWDDSEFSEADRAVRTELYKRFQAGKITKEEYARKYRHWAQEMYRDRDIQYGSEDDDILNDLFIMVEAYNATLKGPHLIGDSELKEAARHALARLDNTPAKES